MAGFEAAGDGGLNARDRLVGLFIIVIWGCNFVAIKAGTLVLPPLLLTGLRFALVAVLVMPFCLTPVPRRQLPLLLLLSSLMGNGHFGLLFVSQAGLDVPTSAIVSQLAVPFSAVVAKIAYAERLGGWGALGLVLSFIGVVLVVGEPHGADPGSLLAGLVSAAAWALSMAVIKKIGPIRPLVLTGWMAAFAAPQLIALSVIFEHGQMAALAARDWRGWAAVAYTGLLATMVGYSLWYRLLARYPINRVVPLTLLSPIVAVISGILVFGGTLAWYKVLGIAVTMIGVGALQFRQSLQRARPSPSVADLSN